MDQVWIFEIKVSLEDKTDDTLAKNALKQIIETGYGDYCSNSVLLGFVVNKDSRQILAWRCQGGIESEPKAEPTVEPKAKPSAKSKATPKAKPEAKS
jgi:hypothetical protein